MKSACRRYPIGLRFAACRAEVDASAVSNLISIVCPGDARSKPNARMLGKRKVVKNFFWAGKRRCRVKREFSVG